MKIIKNYILSKFIALKRRIYIAIYGKFDPYPIISKEIFLNPSEFNKYEAERLEAKLDINKICDIKPASFSPRPRVDSSLLYFTPKQNFYKIKDPKNLEKITRIFFSHRRKMLKKPFNQLFNGNKKILNTLKIDLNLRPQNLDFDIYYKLTSEYENLRS